MRFTPTLAAAAVLASTANAAYKGFNYGSTFGNGQGKVYADFKYEFEAAKGLPGTNGQFTSARLYTMIQAGTTSTPISAIQAAIDTQTSLLLGIWTSAGQTVVSNEIAALKAAASQYGTSFTNLVAGISVGSEDLYRITPTAIENGETNPGVQPSQLVNYIQQVRAAIKGTGLAGKPVGHVDTWTAYVNGSNAAVIDNLDFLGVDAYPYWQTQMANSIGNANATFYDAYRQTVAVSKNKPVWVTETGWPISGPQQNQAVASANNARIYWEDVTCSLIQGNINLWYYTLQDVQYSTPSPSFGIKPGGDLKAVNPLFDLSCPTGRKSVSFFFPLLLSSFLSPLLLLLLYNVSIASFLVSPLLPAAKTCPPCLCNCTCTRARGPVVQPPHWAGWPSSWVARANGLAKPSDTPTASLSISSTEAPTSTGTFSSSSEMSGASSSSELKLT